MSGHYFALDARDGSDSYTRSLTFRSNRRSFGPYGVEQGIPFDFTCEALEIVGFHGRSGWYLDSIGVHLSLPKIINIAQKDITKDDASDDGDLKSSFLEVC